MIIDDDVIREYLGKNDVEQYRHHWIFSCIENNQHIFAEPDLGKRESIRSLTGLLRRTLEGFEPCNAQLFSALFPDWVADTADCGVVLVVGCPSPYDAMVRMRDGKEQIVFDLIQLHSHVERGVDAAVIVRQLLTHELAHTCIHKQHPVPSDGGYAERLKHIAFDEGFAHLLAYRENIAECDFSELIQTHYLRNLDRMFEALQETDSGRQEDNLLAACSGPYWDKFAAISGKLYLAQHLDRWQETYRDGYGKMAEEMRHDQRALLSRSAGH